MCLWSQPKEPVQITDEQYGEVRGGLLYHYSFEDRISGYLQWKYTSRKECRGIFTPNIFHYRSELIASENVYTREETGSFPSLKSWTQLIIVNNINPVAFTLVNSVVKGRGPGKLFMYTERRSN